MTDSSFFENDIGLYSGVPLAGLSAGRNEVTTGAGGPSNSDDYGLCGLLRERSADPAGHRNPRWYRDYRLYGDTPR